MSKKPKQWPGPKTTRREELREGRREEGGRERLSVGASSSICFFHLSLSLSVFLALAHFLPLSLSSSLLVTLGPDHCFGFFDISFSFSRRARASSHERT